MNALNKKIILIISLIFVVIAVVVLAKNIIPPPKQNIVDNLVENTEDPEHQNEKQPNFLLMDMAWGSKSKDIINKENDNNSNRNPILSSGERYVTYDYSNVFGKQFLPTCLFDKDDNLVAILYERLIDDLEKNNLSLEHQKLASKIHLIFQELYKEDFLWKNTQKKVYDKNLWNKAILNGELEMNSIWLGSNEKIQLITTAYPLFDFLYEETQDKSNGYQAILLVSYEYLKTNKLNALYEIKP